MKRVTFAVPDDLLRKARARAARDGTSLNDLIRAHLVRYAAEANRLPQAIDRLLELAAKHGKGRRLKTWTRDELYDRKPARGS